MKLLFIVLLLALLLGAWAFYKDSLKTYDCSKCSSCNCERPDFYWKKYYGKVPYDAVDVDNESIYQPNIFIGLGHVEDKGVFPGALYRGTSLLRVVAVDGIQTLCDNVMILCSKNKINFQWIKVNNTDVPLLSNNFGFKFVFAGFDSKGFKHFIGRVKKGGVMYVGWILPRYVDSNKSGLYYVKTDKLYKIETKFEILAYMC